MHLPTSPTRPCEATEVVGRCPGEELIGDDQPGHEAVGDVRAAA